VSEEHLWEARLLGAHSPRVLLNTLVYFNTKYFMLQTAENHLSLSFSNILKQWKKNSSVDGKPIRSVYLRYNTVGFSPSQTGELSGFVCWLLCSKVEPDVLCDSNFRILASGLEKNWVFS